MQAIDNLTSLSGTLLDCASHPTLAGYDLVTIHVDAAAPVDEKADLLSRNVGKPLRVGVRSELLGGAAKPGAKIHCRARFDFEGALCEPHPQAGDFVLTPP